MVAYAIISLGVMAAAITTIGIISVFYELLLIYLSGQIIVVRANQQKNDFIKVSKMFTKKIKRLSNSPPPPPFYFPIHILLLLLS